MQIIQIMGGAVHFWPPFYISSICAFGSHEYANEADNDNVPRPERSLGLRCRDKDYAMQFRVACSYNFANYCAAWP